MKKLFALALLCLGVAVWSCDEERVVVDEAITSLKVIGGDTIDVYVGDTAYVNVEYSPSNAPAPRYYWYGYNQLLMRAYEKENMIIARKRGSTTLHIGVRDAEVSTSCVINISPVPFNLSYTEREIFVADTFSIKPYLPADVAQNIRWESSSPSIATVDVNGVVRGVSAGKCEISAIAYTNSDTVCSNKCNLIVRDVNMASLVLSDTVRQIIVEESFQLKASYAPANTTFTEVAWSSSDTCVAVVDLNGNVTGTGLGSCVIFAMNKDRTQIAQCNVIVGFREMTSIDLLCEKKDALHHDEFSLETVVKPVNATRHNNALRWRTSNEAVAMVDELTGLITCVTPGECLVTAYNIYNSVSDSCHLVVSPLLVANIELHGPDSLYLRDEKELSYTVFPQNATDNRVKWESSDENIVVIDSKGNVKAVGVGTAMITLSALDASGVMIQSALTVNTILMEKIEFPDINDDSIQLVLDSVMTYKIKAVVSPDNTIDKDLQWESSDESVASVDGEGNITAIGKGKAEITVSALDGSGCNKSCKVEVVDKQWLADTYIRDNVSISLSDSALVTIKGESYTIYDFEVFNNGKENTCVEKVKLLSDDSDLITKPYVIAAENKARIRLESKDVKWIFKHNGYECIKED